MGISRVIPTKVSLMTVIYDRNILEMRSNKTSIIDNCVLWSFTVGCSEEGTRRTVSQFKSAISSVVILLRLEIV
jgi:hypothetical protein